MQPKILNNTHPDDDSIPTATIVNLRKAFHIVGALIGEGMIEMNMDNANWQYQLSHAVITTASALNHYEL